VHFSTVYERRRSGTVQRPGGIDIFGRLNRLRRRRNTTEYPDPDSPTVTEDDARQALATIRETLDAAKRLMESGRLGPFE
jgi:hypothetical protein